MWPTAIKMVIKGPSGDPVAVCYHDGSILWIADTGCGYHLVPEGDVSRGKSVVVPNTGATRLHTANGEVDASECVKFSLSEIQLQKGLATILPQTPRVLSVGALCMDARATFHWPAGGTPFFTLHDGSIVWCEVHGRVPYLRTGGQSALTDLLGNPALPMVAPPSLDVSPATPPLDVAGELAPLLLDAPPALPPLSVARGPMAAKVAPPAAAASDDAAAKGPPAAYRDDPEVLPPPPPPEALPPAPAPDDAEIAPGVDDPVLVADRLERARKLEASSLRHLMTHHPKNMYCQTCCMAKMQCAPHRRKQHRFWSGKPESVTFGDQITADHIVAYSERSQGVTGDCAALVLGDKATGWLEGYAIAGKTTVDTSCALRYFAGSEVIKRAWSDNSPELIAAFHETGVTHDTSTQGRPQSNGRAERLVRRCMDGARTLSLQAGLPPCFWPSSMRAYCFAQNIDILGGDSAWNKRHGDGQWTADLPYLLGA